MTATSDQDRTKATYGLQWNRFRILRPEEDRATFFGRTGQTAEDLIGATILDAGCGMGRYLRVAAEAGANVVGLDLSESTRAAKELTADLADRVLVLRGDLLRPPLAERSFDQVYSIGVLDHTPDPRRAFLSLARLLKPGGRIAIWVYRKERPALERIIDAHRAVSTRLPLGVLLGLSRAMAPVGGLKRGLMASRNRLVAQAGVALNLATLGVSMHPDPEVPRLRHSRLVCAEIYVATHVRRGRRLVRRGGPGRRGRPVARTGLLPRRPGERDQHRRTSAFVGSAARTIFDRGP